MKMSEYINSLPKKDLEILVTEFAELLIEQEMISFIGDSDIDFLDDDEKPHSPSFAYAKTGDNFL